MSYAGNIQTDELTHKVGSTLFGSCTTLASEAAKAVSLEDFDALLDGVTVQVKFLYSNTAANPTLNVNNTGAKSIYVRGVESPGATPATSWDANSVVSFTYDGTNWMMNDANVALTEIVGDGVLPGFTATNLTGAANELKNTLNSLAIQQTGDTATQAIPPNAIIYLTGNTNGLADGYYRNQSGLTIQPFATFTSSNLQLQNDGALSAVSSQLNTLEEISNYISFDTTKIDSYDAYYKNGVVQLYIVTKAIDTANVWIQLATSMSKYKPVARLFNVARPQSTSDFGGDYYVSINNTTGSIECIASRTTASKLAVSIAYLTNDI